MFGASMDKVNELCNTIKQRNDEIVRLTNDLVSAREELDSFKDKVKEMDWQFKHLKETLELENEKKINVLKTSMQESLIKSDLLRTEALAKLEIYEKTDTKADANCIKDMIKQLIDNSGKQKSEVHVIK